MRHALPLLLTLTLACAQEFETPMPDATEEIPAPSQDMTPDTTQTPTDPPEDPPKEPEGDACALTEWEQMMLDRHNGWRAAVEPPAKDMHRLYWDRQIAANAAAWVDSCDPEWPHSPDEARAGVGGFEALGENLSWCAGTGCAMLPEVTDGSGLGDAQGWWEEYEDYTWETDESAGVTSHYTQMTSANVYALGCATKLCAGPGPFGWDGMWWWTACQYGPRGQAYWRGNKPFERGDGGLIEPPAEVWERHEGLCRP